jgi:WD40 repeat protein
VREAPRVRRFFCRADRDPPPLRRGALCGGAKRVFFLSVVAMLLVAFAPAAWADAAGPILRIETGMHGADINRLALSGGELITVSDDKTTRRWSLGDGQALGVWRTPIGEGDVGALYAVAAAGDTIVVGGRTAPPGGKAALYVLDRAGGQMRGSIGGFDEAVSALAFSRDGALLAVGQQGRGGLTLIDFAGRKLVAQDKAYGNTVQWLAFAPDGRLATSAADGKIRLYDVSLAKLAEASLPHGGFSRPWGLAFSPDGRTLAVGSLDRPGVQLFDAGTLKPLSFLGGAPQSAGALSVVAWSEDGATLVAGGSYKDGFGRRALRFWQLRGSVVASSRDVGVARDTISDVAMLPDGRAVYVSAEPSFGIIAASGQQVLHRTAEHCDFRDAWEQAFRVSRDGATVDFPSVQGGKARFRFDLFEGALTLDPPPRADLQGPVASEAGLAMTDWRNTAIPRLNGRGIALEAHELVRSVAVVPGARAVAMGTDFYLRLERPQGETWRTIVPAPAWSVAASGDGRLIVAALGDGTIRWYGARDGKEILSLFVDPVDRRWVAWIPQGFFDHSRDQNGRSGETLIGFQLDNGQSRAADFVSIGQLYALFYRRDLVLAQFRGGPREAKLVADQLARVGDVRAVLAGGLPPHLELIEACIRPAGATGCPSGSTRPARAIDRRVTVAGAGSELFARYRVEDRGGGLGRVILRRNGAAIEGGAIVESEDRQQRVESVSVPLNPGGNSFRLITETANGAIQSADQADVVIEAKPAAATVTAAPAVPDVVLYLVAVGVSQYQIADFRLDNAANDARALGDLLRPPSPPVYDRAEVTTLLDGQATAANIAAALGAVGAKARPQDVVVIFFSGHGEAVDGKYFYAPVDFAARHPEQIDEARHADEARQGAIIDTLFREDGFGEAQLLPLLEKIQGNLLLVLDTCYSATLATGDAVGERARNETIVRSVGHETGRFILAGARTLALDSSGGAAKGADAHGLFTSYLLRGLDGDADLQHVGRINVAELLMFTKTAVREESRKLNLEQEPFYYFSGSNFFDIRAVAARR